MRYETLKRMMEALADVAEAVGGLRALFPAGSDAVDELAQAVTEVGDHVLEAAMLGEVGSPERTGSEQPREFTADEKARLREIAEGMGRPERPAAEPKAKRAYVRKNKAAKPADEKPAEAARTPPRLNTTPSACPDCGAAYVKTSNVQKRCPACRDKMQREQKAAWAERRREDKNPAATAERLAKIKAANERLDRIPEPGEQAG